MADAAGRERAPAKARCPEKKQAVSSAVRCKLATTSAREYCCGSAARAFSVGSGTSGITAMKSSFGDMSDLRDKYLSDGPLARRPWLPPRPCRRVLPRRYYRGCPSSSSANRRALRSVQFQPAEFGAQHRSGDNGRRAGPQADAERNIVLHLEPRTGSVYFARVRRLVASLGRSGCVASRGICIGVRRRDTRPRNPRGMRTLPRRAGTGSGRCLRNQKRSRHLRCGGDSTTEAERSGDRYERSCFQDEAETAIACPMNFSNATRRGSMAPPESCGPPARRWSSGHCQ